jgi:hypothetical protein
MSTLKIGSKLAVAAMVLMTWKPAAYAQTAYYKVIIGGVVFLATPSLAYAKSFLKKNPEAVIEKVPSPRSPAPPPATDDDDNDNEQ